MTSSNLHNLPSDDDRHFIRFASRRSVVHSTKGIIASTQPLANEAGYKILAKGGNAADAAVAVAAALNVTGIGGDMFLLFYDAQKKKVFALNGSGRAPASLTIAKLRKKGIKGTNIPMTDVNAVTVPGAAEGWITTIQNFGSGKLSVDEILEPAIKLAEEGFPVSELTAESWEHYEDQVKTASPNGHEMLRNGRAPRTGEIFRNPNLAETFRTLAREGSKGFYEGRIAQAIVDVIQLLGGEMTLEDLKGHKTELVEPITLNYQGLDIWECPPNGQGIVALMALGIIQELQEMKKIPPLSQLGHNSPGYLHVIIEALRMAFADAVYHVADPHYYPQPDHLLSKSYLQSRAKLFDLHKQVPRIYKGEPISSSDTVYFSVTDQWGNAASFINSNFAGFGTAIVPKDCGFTLQCRGSGFVLRDGDPNCLKGGKRPYHTIIPAMVRGLRLTLTNFWLRKTGNFGLAMPTLLGHVQVLLNMLAFGCSPQTALDAPRIAISPHDTAHPEALVHLESGVPPEAIQGLRKLGHNVRVETGEERVGYFGRGQIIRVRRRDKEVECGDGWVYSAGSDMRGDGAALAFNG